jgi:hypothetical protein
MKANGDLVLMVRHKAQQLFQKKEAGYTPTIGRKRGLPGPLLRFSRNTHS